MDESHAQHFGQLAAHATQLHQEALALVRPGAPADQLKAALEKLGQVELLAQDLDSWGAFPQVETALAHLAEQQAMLRLAIARLEAVPHVSAGNAWQRPWPWISLAGVILAAIAWLT